MQTFNFEKATERHIRRILLKIKSLASSEAVQSEPWFTQSDEKIQASKATANLNGRLFKTNVVKEAVESAISSLKRRLVPAESTAVEKTFNSETLEKSLEASVSKVEELLLGEAEVSDADDFDEEELSKFDSRIANSDSESDPEPDNHQLTRNLSISLSPPPPNLQTKKPLPKATPSGSMFVPALAELGYISASDSSASDIQIAPRKNRRGQRERRAIAEKKYGSRAQHLQHLQAEKGPSQKGGRDAGWDPRRGAVAKEDLKHKRGFRGQRFEKSVKSVKAEKPASKPKRDDTGKLHPSWVAAKAAKSKEKGGVGQFSGKLVTFD